MKCKKRFVFFIVVGLLVLCAVFLQMENVRVHYSGRWWGYSTGTSYGRDKGGQERIVGRSLTVGPIAFDRYYTMGVTNEPAEDANQTDGKP
jgi:hypothetical protein